ncbi:MAG: hypothetical protein A2Y10_17730 [Planctomycetes bacterium GWF2_41_51]|nr:MAG: hypothetical protein A2Y10_17730 [Planctomycetes bacterium GWF2_41_51]
MERNKATFRTIYSNDTTNIETCVSPFHKKNEHFRTEMLDASISEIANRNVDVHMLQPGLGWMPFWKSNVYPIERHIQYVKERFGLLPEDNGFANYMANGGDIVQLSIDSCKKYSITPFVSMRLNDQHCIDLMDLPKGQFPNSLWLCAHPFHTEHPEWRLGTDFSDWSQRGFDWMIEEVRNYRFSLIREIIENYDIDGFELDFMRVFGFFRQDKTTSEQRINVMIQFVKDVRKLLDDTSSANKRRWLCVRIPAYLETHDSLGIDVEKFYEAGVDMFNLSYHFFTEQQGDIRQIRKKLPDASVYVEMTNTTQVGRLEEEPGYDNFAYRRTTPTQFYTTAHLAYSRGIDGVSLFNFVYYREHGTGKRGEFHEPPFEVLSNLSKPVWLAQQPQHYVLSGGWNDPKTRDWPLPKLIDKNQVITFSLDMAPPVEGWSKKGKLRIQAEKSLEESFWKAKLNSIELKQTIERSEYYESKYKEPENNLSKYIAWDVPVNVLNDGFNEIEITMIEGGRAKIVFLDIAIK